MEYELKRDRYFTYKKEAEYGNEAYFLLLCWQYWNGSDSYTMRCYNAWDGRWEDAGMSHLVSYSWDNNSTLTEITREEANEVGERLRLAYKLKR